MVKDDDKKDDKKPAPTQMPAPKKEEHATPKQATAAEKAKADEAAMAKAREQSTKVEQEAIAKAATINQRLARDNDPKRIGGGVRRGEPKFFWGQFVPTRELTDEELKAVESL